MAKNTNKVAKAWGGVFTESTDAQMEKFSESISFDSRMYAQDIRGSIGHARMLADVGILTNEEFEAIERELLAIKARIEAGDFEYSTALEDIHMHVEKALIEKLGDVGRKLHTARSRNDQVSTDFRLWIRDSIDALDTLWSSNNKVSHKAELKDDLGTGDNALFAIEAGTLFSSLPLSP